MPASRWAETPTPIPPCTIGCTDRPLSRSGGKACGGTVAAENVTGGLHDVLAGARDPVVVLSVGALTDDIVTRNHPNGRPMPVFVMPLVPSGTRWFMRAALQQILHASAHRIKSFPDCERDANENRSKSGPVLMLKSALPTICACVVGHVHRERALPRPVRRTAQGPQRVLQAFCQRHIPLAAQDHVRVLKARTDQPEVIQPMIQYLTGDADTQIRHLREVRQAHLPRRVNLPEDYFPIRTMHGAPAAHSTLQRPPDPNR